MTTYGGSIFTLNLRYKRHQIKLDKLWRGHGEFNPLVIAQSRVVDRLHMELERAYRAEREGMA